MMARDLWEEELEKMRTIDAEDILPEPKGVSIAKYRDKNGRAFRWERRATLHRIGVTHMNQVLHLSRMPAHRLIRISGIGRKLLKFLKARGRDGCFAEWDTVEF